MTRRKKKNWSYNAGERGRNWCRVFRQARDGKYYLQWMQSGRKRSALLRGVTTAREAKVKADEMAARFAHLELGLAPERPKPTLVQLLDHYLKEVTPTKGTRTQDHDRSARRLWIAFLDCQPEPARRSGRFPHTLDRIDWDRFIVMRRHGEIPGWGRNVGDRMVNYDLRFMIAVLNWGVGARLLDTNPWGAEIRRAQRWVLPQERNPKRPSMTDELREGLIAHHTAGWQFGAMLKLQRETVRRNSSIRRLRWSDINLQEGTIHWRAKTDKSGRENVTPLSPKAVEILRSIPRGIGDVPVFPAPKDPTRHTSQYTCALWLKRAKERWLAAVPEEEREDLRRRLKGVGYHAEKRAGVRDPSFRALPASVQQELAGTNFDTLREVYDKVTVDQMRAYMKRASSGSN